MLGIVSINIVPIRKISKNLEGSLKGIRQVLVPIFIFQDRNLTPLEAIVKFLRERKELSYHKISKLLNRHVRDIYKLYKNSVKKSSKFKVSLEEPILIPISIFADRKFSALEAITVYLHDKLHLKFSEIGKLLNRDQRTIWTVYSRARKKYGRKK